MALFSLPEIERGVYLISCTTMPGIYKIGMTTNVRVRLKDFRAKYPAHRFELVRFISYEPAGQLERAVHRYYQHGRIEGEWFYLTPQEVIDYQRTTVGKFMFGPNEHRLAETLAYIMKIAILPPGDTPQERTE